MEIEVIKPKASILNVKKRVCAYCRVSTDADEQENSLENQITHYESKIKSNPAYEFVDVYYDFGISGYKEKRPGFQKMMKDAINGKIDLVITKSVSRLARNTVIVLEAARELKELNVGIFFELQNINTLSEDGELMLTIISAFAQAESEAASKGAKMVYMRRYQQGNPIHYLERSYGYKRNSRGVVVPEPEDAKWIVSIFEMAAEGYTVADITRHLVAKGVKTVQGAKFIDSTTIRILENEIYKGDYIMHKHFVNAERKLIRNRGEVDAWHIREDHVPIVSRKLWKAAQEQIAKKRDYLAAGSLVGEPTEEIYPYMKQIFCAECGYPLYRRVYSNGNRVNWGCSGTKRYHRGFCKGINIPDTVIRSWGELHGNTYIRKMEVDKGKKYFSYVSEKAWKKINKAKEIDLFRIIPKLNEANYPYRKKIYCAKCGKRLVRMIQADKVVWICNGWKRKGKNICGGTRIYDEVIRSWGDITDDIYISREEGKDGKKCYSYSCKPSGRGEK